MTDTPEQVTVEELAQKLIGVADGIALIFERLSVPPEMHANITKALHDSSDLLLSLSKGNALAREALEASRSFVEMTVGEEQGEEAADAKHVLDQVDTALTALGGAP